MGIVGAQDYQRDHAANEIEEFNFFIESDIGTFGSIFCFCKNLLDFVIFEMFQNQLVSILLAIQTLNVYSKKFSS